MLQFDNYTVIKKIGEGGAAIVYLVENQYGGKFALKELKEDLFHDEVQRIRFTNESEIIYNIDCRNIIKIVAPTKLMQVYEEEKPIRKSYAYIMEYFPAKALKDLINAQNLSPDRVKKVTRDILNALDFCHCRNIIHRDIKPANILLRKNSQGEEEAVLTDFGIAKMAEYNRVNDELTIELVVLGAPAYMSPEQIRDSRNVDSKSDLYSLGVVLYEMLTGRKPFTGSKWDIIAQHENPKMKPIPPSSLAPEIDPKLENVILRLLEKDPEKRPQSAKDALILLDDSTSTTGLYAITENYNKIFYKNNILVKIAYLSGERIVKKGIYKDMPLVIGRYSPGRSYETSRFDLPEGLKSVSKEHCEIFVNSKNEVSLRDRSKGGSIINNSYIKNESRHLREGKNELILANSAKLKIEIIKVRQLNFTTIYICLASFAVIVLTAFLIIKNLLK